MYRDDTASRTAGSIFHLYSCHSLCSFKARLSPPSPYSAKSTVRSAAGWLCVGGYPGEAGFLFVVQQGRPPHAAPSSAIRTTMHMTLKRAKAFYVYRGTCLESSQRYLGEAWRRTASSSCQTLRNAVCLRHDTQPASTPCTPGSQTKIPARFNPLPNVEAKWQLNHAPWCLFLVC